MGWSDTHLTFNATADYSGVMTFSFCPLLPSSLFTTSSFLPAVLPNTGQYFRRNTLLPPTSFLNFRAQDFLPCLLRAHHCARGPRHALLQPWFSSPFLGHVQTLWAAEIPAWLPEGFPSTEKSDSILLIFIAYLLTIYSPMHPMMDFSWIPHAETFQRGPLDNSTGLPLLCARKHLPSTNGIMWLNFGLQKPCWLFCNMSYLSTFLLNVGFWKLSGT